jgi:hypothetical protein
MLCRYDGLPLELDREIARACIESGWPAVELLRCKNGHSVRADAPYLRTGPAPKRLAPICPVCGAVVQRSKRSSRKFCSDHCARFCSGMRTSAYQRGEPFVLEAQPWYAGTATSDRVAEPLPPLDPLAGRMPRDWAAGWLRVHELEPVEGGA